MTALSQRDPKWKDLILGFNPGPPWTIGGFGCLITDFAIILDTTPDVINEKLRAVKAFTEKSGLVIWPLVKQALPLDFSQPLPYDNDGVKEQIAQNGFCIVEVDFDGKIDSKNDFHWVTYIGNQQLIDPWTGSTKSTGWYSKVLSYVKCTKTGVPAASDGKWIKDYLTEKGIDITHEGDARAKLGDVFNEAAKYDQANSDKVKAQNALAEALGANASLETENKHLRADGLQANNDNIDKDNTIVDRDITIAQLRQQLAAAGQSVPPVVPPTPKHSRLDLLIRWLSGSR